MRRRRMLSILDLGTRDNTMLETSQQTPCSWRKLHYERFSSLPASRSLAPRFTQTQIANHDFSMLLLHTVSIYIPSDV